jgi:protein-tyrosine phosphatase
MKILMVCLGNICRSPLAEGVMQHMVEQEGLDWEIDSAGTGNWHIGHAPHQGSVKIARKHGIDISKQVCRQFKVTDFDEFDLVLVMDKDNLTDVLALARTEADKQKVRLFLGDGEVPDPYYTDRFEEAYQLIEGGCRDIIREYRN